MTDTRNWLQILQAKEFDKAEAKLFEQQPYWNIELGEKSRLMFIQALKNIQELELAVFYMKKYEPDFTESSQKAILYGWLAEALPQINRTDESHEYGIKAINLSDELNTTAFFKNKKNAVVFSLFGENPKYCENAFLNAELMPTIYPDYLMIVYYDDSVPSHVIARLNQISFVETIHVNTINAGHYVGTFWRFLALEDKRLDVILFRDIDSLISEREKQYVENWLAEPSKPFHIIRDWYSQTDLILAGMWGARYQILTDIRKWMDEYIDETKELHKTHADQNFLSEKVWPRIKHLAVHHHTVFASKHATFVGEVTLSPLGNHAMGGVDMTGYTVSTLPDNMCCEFLFTKGTETICSYHVYPPQTTIFFPKPYRQRVESGEYQLHIIPKIKIVLERDDGTKLIQWQRYG